MVYCHNRTYCPYIGRWLSRDPTGADGGINVYEFCGNNPLMFSDPSGLMFTHGAASGERGPGGGYCESDSYLSGVGGVFKGYGSALVDSAEGAVTSGPIFGLYSSYQMCREALADPQGYCDRQMQGLQNTWNNATAGGSPQEYGRLWGKVFIAAGSAAAGGAEAPAAVSGLSAEAGAGETITVSRWGRPGLEPGDWVMNGPATKWNYIKSGKWDPFPWNEYAPFSGGEEFQVPASSVVRPSGMGADGWVKGLFGQRRYLP